MGTTDETKSTLWSWLTLGKELTAAQGTETFYLKRAQRRDLEEAELEEATRRAGEAADRKQRIILELAVAAVAISDVREHDARWGELMELHYLAGLDLLNVSRVMGVSVSLANKLHSRTVSWMRDNHVIQDAREFAAAHPKEAAGRAAASCGEVGHSFDRLCSVVTQVA